jgi:hypothetical protein
MTMRPRRTWASILFVMILGLASREAFADWWALKIRYGTGALADVPLMDLLGTAPQYLPRGFTAMVDSGAAGSIWYLNQAGEIQPVLSGGTPSGTAGGVGNGRVDRLTGVTLAEPGGGPAMQIVTLYAPKIPAGQAATQPPFPATFNSIPMLGGLQPIDAIIPGGWVRSFQCSLGVANNAGGAPALFLITTTQLPNGQQGCANADRIAAIQSTFAAANLRPDGFPVGTDSIPASYVASSQNPDGSLDLDGGYYINVSIALPGGSYVTAPFLIKSGSPASIIGPTLAASMGIVPGSLNAATLTVDAASFTAPYTSANVQLFPTDSTFPTLSLSSAFVLDSSTDPQDINVIGADLLYQVAYWEIDTSDLSTNPNTFNASATIFAAPLPTWAMLSLGAVLLLLALSQDVRPALREYAVPQVDLTTLSPTR